MVPRSLCTTSLSIRTSLCVPSDSPSHAGALYALARPRIRSRHAKQRARALSPSALRGVKRPHGYVCPGTSSRAPTTERPSRSTTPLATRRTAASPRDDHSLLGPDLDEGEGGPRNGDSLPCRRAHYLQVLATAQARGSIRRPQHKERLECSAVLSSILQSRSQTMKSRVIHLSRA